MRSNFHESPPGSAATYCGSSAAVSVDRAGTQVTAGALSGRAHRLLAATLLATLCVALAFLSDSARASGTTIYKSVDQQGRVTYSDQPPAANTLVEVLEYQAGPMAPSALDVARIEAMRQVTDRMAADRREREANRARARQERRSSQTDYRAVEGEDFWLYSGGYYPVYRPHRPSGPGYRPPGIRPPGLRPPLVKPQPRRLPAVNDYPASLVRRHYAGGARRVFYNDQLPGR